MNNLNQKYSIHSQVDQLLIYFFLLALTSLSKSEDHQKTLCCVRKCIFITNDCVLHPVADLMKKKKIYDGMEIFRDINYRLFSVQQVESA